MAAGWPTNSRRQPPVITPGWPVRALAIDGKTLRASAGAGKRPVHLLAAMDHASQVVLTQVEVAGKTNEITRFAPLPDGLELHDTVITADAIRTQREHADWLVTVRHAQRRSCGWTVRAAGEPRLAGAA